MVLLSSTLLLRSYSLLLLSASYYLLYSPATLLTSTPIWILGESMHIPRSAMQPRTLHNPLTNQNTTQSIHQGTREVLALLGFGCAVYAVLQMVLAGALSVEGVKKSRTSGDGGEEDRRLGEEIYAIHTAQDQWMTVAGLRVVGMGIVVGWMYVFHSSRGYGLGKSMLREGEERIGFGLLANQVVFTAAMMDMLFWGYLWTVVREEARELASVVARRREEKEIRLE